MDLVVVAPQAVAPAAAGKACMFDRSRLRQALALAGFDQWDSPFSRVPIEANEDGEPVGREFDSIQSGDQNFRPRQRPVDLPGQGRTAAVMLMLFPLSHRASMSEAQNRVSFFANSTDHVGLVLTQRPNHLNNHGGQISLPGGRQEPDESLSTTALRETQEEVGIKADSIELLGRLQPVYIPPSDFTVFPFVGWHPGLPCFVRNADEVDRILIPSLSKLLTPEIVERDRIYSGRRWLLDVPFFALGGYRVWGATAIVISELLERVGRVID